MLLMLLCSGCGLRLNPFARNHVPATEPSAPNSAAEVLKRPAVVYEEVTPGMTPGEHDQFRAFLDALTITAPTGTLAADRDLWQVISDRTLSPEQQRLFASNGLRIGLMEIGAWQRFKEISDHYPGVTSRATNIRGDVRAEFEPLTADAQTLFYFDRNGRLQGRTFDNSENFWALNFAPQPSGKVPSVRVEICPVVRAARGHLQFTRVNNEREVSEVRPESLYDVGLRIDVPVGMVLVVAATPDSANASGSIGQAFLTIAEPSGLRDEILILYPRMFRFDEKATNAKIEQFLADEARRGELPR
jgi:hypothetical protein